MLARFSGSHSIILPWENELKTPNDILELEEKNEIVTIFQLLYLDGIKQGMGDFSKESNCEVVIMLH